MGQCYVYNIHNITNIKMPKKIFQLKIEDNLHRKLKMKAVEKDTTMTDIIINLVKKYLKEK